MVDEARVAALLARISVQVEALRRLAEDPDEELLAQDNALPARSTG